MDLREVAPFRLIYGHPRHLHAQKGKELSAKSAEFRCSDREKLSNWLRLPDRRADTCDPPSHFTFYSYVMATTEPAAGLQADIKDSILDTVGETPLIRLPRIGAGL